ncbi:MAG: class I SAM-dependent methyltransferase [Bacteroidales bacterium]|nr:class I SAM-dependent methyltransferase [Bacteroidales bacterium]
MVKMTLISTASSFGKYYRSLNSSYHKAFSKYLMMHYPMFSEKNESLERRQTNLTDFCIAQLASLKDKRVLEIGCGNGVQSIYIASKFEPVETIGIDLNEENINLARRLEHKGNRVIFHVDDAHKLENIADNSVDTIVCIESAFHYPEKELFLTQIHRVLKDDGEFVIADILSRNYKKRLLLRNWKKRMFYYHWTLDHYVKSFHQSSLEVEKTFNITPDIIMGYKGYLKWVKIRDVESGLMRYLALQIFMLIQVNINLHLLRTRRQYMIFKGKKKMATM